MSVTVLTWRSTGLPRRPILLAVLLLLTAVPAAGQEFNLFGDNLTPGKPATGLAVEASLTAERLESGAVGTLSVSAMIPKGYHLYSMDPGYTGRTKIDLAKTTGIEPLGEFKADHPPKRRFDSTLEQEVEEYEDRVTWSRPVRIVDPSAAKVEGKLTGTYCSTGAGGMCLRANESFAATLAQVDPQPGQAASSSASFTSVETPEVGGKAGPATVRFSLSPEDAQPGQNVTLTATMTLGEGWHTYAVNQRSVAGAMPTAFTLKQTKGLTPISDSFVADQEPEAKTNDAGASVLEHGGTVTWSRQFRVDDAGYGVAGSIKYVTCRDGLCLRPQTLAFNLGDLDGAGPVPAALPAATADPLSETFETSDSAQSSLPLFLGLAFLGGLVLNIMPCVLPVVAIKVMSFVQQAGEDRGRVFALNAVYAIGVISVFLLLAALAALPEWFGWFFEGLGLSGERFSWGGLFQSETFNLIMACLVFAMGLSLLGVFEIPIPGMIGSAAGATQREGLTGAFLTGVFATLLATPCTGPFMGTTLAWSVKQPAAVTFLVWATMGLGMASPYLVFGLVPGAVKLLPRPGAWMVQFKEFAGLVLMGTVVWLMSSLNTKDIVPLLVMLLGIAFTFWLIGTIQFSPSTAKRRIVSAAAVALGLGIGAFGYFLTLEPTNKLAWEPFSTQRVNALRAEGAPVLIDFTASWCANCKVNERMALNTADTKAAVEKLGVVPLIADYSDESPEIKEWLDRFGRDGIPLTVIFPANRPNDPILLDGLISQRTLLEKLEEAVRPKPVATTAVKTADAR